MRKKIAFQVRDRIPDETFQLIVQVILRLHDRHNVDFEATDLFLFSVFHSIFRAVIYKPFMNKMLT